MATSQRGGISRFSGEAYLQFNYGSFADEFGLVCRPITAYLKTGCMAVRICENLSFFPNVFLSL